MPTYRKPKLGLLGLMTDGYEPIFPGITERQENYAREIVRTVADTVDLHFSGAGLNRESIEMRMRELNSMDLDGVLIVLLAYSQGSLLVRALQDNRLPIALAVVQPDQQVKEDWEELDLTVNQGIHGAQDNANAIVRLGIPCQFFAGNRHEDRFKNFVTDFGKAAQAATLMKRTRVAIIGRMGGMNDILTDDMSVLRKIGPEYVHESLGSVYAEMQQISDADIDARIKLDHEIFDMDPKLSHESHAYAVRMYLGFKRFLENGNYGAFTAHFDFFGADGRFKQLPLMAASHLMADGYGYAAEGDALCASMVAAAHCIGNADGNFTEMYTMDFPSDSIIFCHAGEGNWSTARKDMKPRLIDRYLGEGGLDNPPTPIFTPQYGPATLTCLAPMAGDTYKLLVSKGEILSKSDMRRCEMPYFFYRPNTGMEKCVEGWLENGGTHHEVINLGDVSNRWKMLAKIWEVPYIEV